MRIPGARGFAQGSGLVSVEHGPLAKLTLRRPEKLNSLSLPMIHDLK